MLIHPPGECDEQELRRRRHQRRHTVKATRGSRSAMWGCEGPSVFGNVGAGCPTAVRVVGHCGFC
jgi:hypothetical protein